MGEPAPLSPDEIKQLIAFAWHVVEAVRNDLEAPRQLYSNGDAMPDETMIFKLSQLVCMLFSDDDGDDGT